MKINRLITPYNRTVRSSRKIQYIVIHYVGTTSSAQNNVKYFAKKKVGASAHYFVGHSGEIWQSVEDKDIAWHCGGRSYRHKYCRNTNSIGVELCCRNNGSWYFEQATVNSALSLVSMLMKKYNVPRQNILRHYDITGKICPEPYVRNSAAFEQFKNSLLSSSTITITPPSPIKHSTLLKTGSKGGAVKDLQNKLNSLGYNSGTADGVFGRNTKTAVMKFQRDNNLAVDGIAGNNTLAALNKAKPSATPQSAKPSTSSGNNFIKQVQTVLNNSYGASLAVDGIVGPLTRKALPVVKQGNKGAIVTIVQQRIIALGFSVGKAGADGDFGSGTKSGVISFQKAKGLGIDGIVGQNTWSKLLG